MSQSCIGNSETFVSKNKTITEKKKLCSLRAVGMIDLLEEQGDNVGLVTSYRGEESDINL